MPRLYTRPLGLVLLLFALLLPPHLSLAGEEQSHASLASGNLSFTLDDLGLPMDGTWEMAIGPDGQGNPGLILTLTGWEAQTESFKGILDGRIILSPSPEGLIPSHVTLTSDDILLPDKGVHHSLSFTSFLEQDRDANRYYLKELECRLGDIALVTGSALLAPDDPIPLKSASLVGESSDLEQVLDLLKALGIDATGGTDLAGAVSIALEASEKDSGLDITALAEPRSMSLAIDGQSRIRQLTGTANLSIPLFLDAHGLPVFGEWSLTADLGMHRVGAPEGSEWLDLRLDLSGPDQNAEGFPFPLQLRELAITPRGKDPETHGLLASASILPTSGGGLTSDDLRLQVARAGMLDGAFWLPGGEDDPIPPALAAPDDTPSEEELSEQQYLKLKGDDVDLAPLAGFLTDMLGLGLDEYSPRGRAGVEFTLETRDDGPLLATCDLRVSGGGFASSDGLTLGDKLAFRIGLEYGLEEAPRLVLSTGVSTGEMLLAGVTYINFSDTALGATLVGSPRFGQGVAFPSMRLVLGLKNHGRAVFNGSASLNGDQASLDGHLAVTDANLAVLFATFLRDKLSINNPGLADMVIEGSAAMDCDLEHSPSGTRIKGVLNIDQGRLGLGDKGQDIVLADLALYLPFSYDFSTTASASSAPAEGEWGRLTASDVLVPTGSMGSVDIPLSLTRNTLFTGVPLIVPLLDGAVTLDNLTVFDPLSDAFRLDCAARLSNIDFSSIDSGVPLLGSISGDLGRVSLDAERLTVERDLNGSFYGGQLSIRDMGVERPLAADRRIRASVSSHLMDFKLISEALGIGNITGRLNLDINDLVIAYGQPAAFSLTARSQEVDDVTQDISLKAVNSIAVMGTGSGIGDVGVGVFASFFESFAYDDIGIACELDRDVFKINGLIKEGDVEYFIKKPLMFGINVINVNPDNRISFKDMLERVKRVVQPDNDEGPIIE